MDEDGNWSVANWDDYGDTVNAVGEDGGTCLRTVKLVVTMRPPAPIIAAVTVPDESGERVTA